jgi:hypothetical protein
MGRDLGSELKQYTVNLLFLIGKEVDGQFGKWNKPVVGFLAKYVAAHDKAAENQSETLKEYDEEVRRTLERTMFIIEILSVPAVAWLGAALELRVGPNLFYSYEDGFKVQGQKYFFKKIHDEFKSKIFGDASKDIADTLFKLTNEKLNSVEPPEPEAKKAAFAPDLDKFGRSLYDEVDKQNTFLQNNINAMTQAINRSATFGEAIVKRLSKENAGFDRLPFNRQFDLGTRTINAMMQVNREKWAASWLYYGNDPPEPHWSRIIEDLEKQLWCIWILQQNFRSVQHGWNLFTEDYKVAGASGKVFDSTGGVASSVKDSPIMERLFEEFQAPLMDYELDSELTTHSKAWADKQVEKLNQWANNQEFDSLRKALTGKPRQLKSIDEMF